MTAAPSLRSVALRYCAAAIGCMAVGWWAISKFGITGPGQTVTEFQDSAPFLNMWIRWDAGWYQRIAETGYTYSATEQSAAAYFPVYPLLMRGLIGLTGVDVFLAGIIVTWLAGLSGVLIFSRWVAALSPVSSLAVTLLLVWPFAFFLYGAVYSDAVFLVLVAGAFLALEKDVLWLAVLLGSIATATRPIAPAVVVGLFARHWELRHRAGKSIHFATLLTCTGALAFMAFLWVKFDDPLGFMTTQAGWGQLQASTSKLDALRAHRAIDLPLPLFHGLLAVSFLACAWPMRKSLGWGYAAYVVVAVGIPLATSRDFIGLGRYAIAGFPCFVQFALLLKERPKLKWVWLLTSAALLVWMTVRFANGRYVS